MRSDVDDEGELIRKSFAMHLRCETVRQFGSEDGQMATSSGFYHIVSAVPEVSLDAY